MFGRNHFLILVLPLLFSACGDVDNSIPPAELTDYKQEIEVTKKWSHTLGGGSDEFHKISPAIFDDSIYTISSDGLISKVSLETAQVSWTQKVDHKIYAGLAVNKEVLVVATSDGLLNVYKNQPKQELVWSKKVESEVNVQPTLSDNNILLRLSNGKLNSYKLENGQLLWSVSRHVPKLSLTGSSKPSIINDQVLSGFDDGSLVSLDKSSGETLWQKKISESKGRSAFDQMIDIDGEFVIKNNIIYISNFQGKLAAIQLVDGSELWSRTMSSVKAISSDDQALYVSDQDSNLWSIDRRTGSALWKQDELHHRQLTGMAVIGNHVVVADFEGFAHWLDKESGSLKARMSIGTNKIINAPVVYQEQILFLDTANQLTSVSILP